MPVDLLKLKVWPKEVFFQFDVKQIEREVWNPGLSIQVLLGSIQLTCTEQHLRVVSLHVFTSGGKGMRYWQFYLNVFFFSVNKLTPFFRLVLPQATLLSCLTLIKRITYSLHVKRWLKNAKRLNIPSPNHLEIESFSWLQKGKYGTKEWKLS